MSLTRFQLVNKNWQKLNFNLFREINTTLQPSTSIGRGRPKNYLPTVVNVKNN